jgi:hypothetical protein
MKRYLSLITFAGMVMLLVTFASMASAQDKAKPAAESPLIKQMYGGGWPSAKELKTVHEQFLLQRAVQSYMMTLPTVNVIGMRDGSEAEFGSGYNVLPIWKDRMDSRALVPTPNADVIYSMSYLDLKETGPLVVYAPPKVIGMFTDFYQRTLTDVGAAGPDRARGGLYLLLPPDYEGPVPGGYFVFKSKTYNVFLFFRTVLTKGEHGPDTTLAVQTAEKTRIFPLGSNEGKRLKMQFPNGSGKRVNMMYPTDFSYWEKLKKYIDYEPVGAFTMEVRGMLASLGIVKGQPFKPSPAAKTAMTAAVELAPKMIYANRITPGFFHRAAYYEDRKYQNAWSGTDANYNMPTFTDIDVRAQYFQYAYSSAPAMVVDLIGAGSKYPVTAWDANGDLLDGANTYKLRLPPNIPAALYWAVTLYNATDGTMPETPQLLPSRNQFDQVTTAADGSVELWFAPKKPEGVDEKNWIQSIPGRAQIVAIRLYGAGTQFYDQTWKPDDVVKVK